MFSLSKVSSKKEVLPPNVIIYGTPKIGKTTFAASAEKPIILDFERGSNNLEVARVGREDLGSFKAVMEVLRVLYKEDHDYKTVVIDSIDWLERMVFEEIAKEHGARSIDDYKVAALGYGKGYTLGLTMIKQLTVALDALRADKGMAVILICHSQVKKFTDPEVESFDRFTLKLNEKIEGLLKEWSECILFARQKVHVTTEETGFKKTVNKGRTGDRVIYTQEAASFLAGNRYDLPRELPLDYKAFWTAFVKGTGYNSKKTSAPKAAKVIQIPTTTMGMPAAAYAKLNGASHNNDFLDI